MRALPLACLLLLLLCRVPGAGAQEPWSFRLQQPQARVSVRAGGTLTLTCTATGEGPPGPVKWLKGWGSDNKTVYDQSGSLSRVTRLVEQSNTDFSIQIRDVQPEDASTYYCVKFRKTLNGVELFDHGKGTEVSIHAEPSTPVVSGPDGRAGPGQPVPFTCTAGGFFPSGISVKWFKDEAPVSAQQPQVTPRRTQSSYDMSSTVTMTLQKDDVRSKLACEVQHPTLAAPLRGTYQLRDALRVSPSVRVESQSRVELNETVNFTCHVEGFYPGAVAVTWLEDGVGIKVEKVSRAVVMPSGLFDLRSPVEVQATVEKNGSLFTCRVVHDGQDPVSRTSTLWIAVPAQEGQRTWSQTHNAVNLLSSPGLWLGILLEKGLLGGLLIILFKRGRA